MAMTSGYSDGWLDGSTPLHMFTGPMETFKYLLTQEQFMVDLDTRSNNDLSVSTYQLIFSWPYSAANARLCLQTPGHLERVAKERSVRTFSGTSTNLNMAVSHPQGHQKESQIAEMEPSCGDDKGAGDGIQRICHTGFAGSWSRHTCTGRRGSDTSRYPVNKSVG